jgi:hypothetical protein
MKTTMFKRSVTKSKPIILAPFVFQVWLLLLVIKAEMLATRVDESWTHHFQLGPTKVFKLSILTILGLKKIFRRYAILQIVIRKHANFEEILLKI